MVVELEPVANKEETYHVVGFEITPRSVNYDKLKQKKRQVDLTSKDAIGQYLEQEDSEASKLAAAEPQELLMGRQFAFSYSV